MSYTRYLYKFKHASGEEFSCQFSLTGMTSDCGSSILSAASLNFPSQTRYRKDMVAAIKRAIRISFNQYAMEEEYRKAVLSCGHDSQTYKFGKALRFRFLTAKSAHGGHRFYYAVGTFNLSAKKFKKPKSVKLISAQSGQSYITSETNKLRDAFNNRHI